MDNAMQTALTRHLDHAEQHTADVIDILEGEDDAEYLHEFAQLALRALTSLSDQLGRYHAKHAHQLPPTA